MRDKHESQTIRPVDCKFNALTITLILIQPAHTEQFTNQGSTATVSYQTFIGPIMSPTCPHCKCEEETAEHLLLSCPKWAAERQQYFGDSIIISDVFQDGDSLVEFLITLGHLSTRPPTPYRQCLMGLSQQQRRDNDRTY